VPSQKPQIYEEIRVYEGVVERTGARFERSEVRRSNGYCASLTDFMRKARTAGEGTFYVPLGSLPENLEQLELRKPWVVMS